MRVVYIASEPTLIVNTVAIACGFRSLYSDAENILVDPRALLWPDYDAPSLTDKFLQNGFKSVMLDRQDFQEVLRYEFPFSAYLLYMKLFQRMKPSVIVVMHEYGYSYYAVQTARLMGIPSYHIQHAVFEPGRFEISQVYNKLSKQQKISEFLLKTSRCGMNPISSIGKLLRRIMGRKCPDELISFRESLQAHDAERYPIYADRIALWSDYYKQLLMQNRPDFEESRIDVVGFPHGDNFVKRKMISSQEVLAEYGFSESSKIALYIYCPFHEIEGNIVRIHPEKALLDTVRSLGRIDPEISIVILPHPNYNLSRQIERLKVLASEFNNVVIQETASDFLSLCLDAIMVVGVSSSLFYLAMLVQVPVVIQAYVLESLADYQAIEGGGAIPVFSEMTLSHQLKKALYDSEFLHRLRENQKCLAGNILGVFDGRSGLRTAEAILTFCIKNHALTSGGS